MPGGYWGQSVGTSVVTPHGSNSQPTLIKLHRLDKYTNIANCKLLVKWSWQAEM